ncbi:MAG: hypothetical protein Q7L07_14220 [Pseudohongiella sp.]|nr:hypothetical protein [Pseudohongiella sp.]MDP1757493.1 hypothetical protein [Pseudohongiella sp.]
MRLNIVKPIAVPGERYAAAIQNTRIVPASVPKGLYYLRAGRLLVVSGRRVSIELAPVTSDLVGFTALVRGAGRFKPSFFVAPPSAADTAYWQANKNSAGIALRVTDVNGDGINDYVLFTQNGVQPLFGAAP